jgi:hypothetical protein
MRAVDHVGLEKI